VALYRVAVHKRMTSEFTGEWSNVYTVNTAGAEQAADTGVDIAGFEMQVSYDVVEVYKISVSPAPGTTPGGAIRFVSIPGVQTGADASNILPMWNTVLVTFGNLGGRPERKYLRLPLTEGDVVGRNLEPGARSLVSLSYAAQLATISEYVGPNGEGHTDGTVAVPVQMRQTDWNRRARPGFRRGWVPI